MRIVNRPEVQLQNNIISASKYIKEMNLCITELDNLYVENDRGLYFDKLMKEFDREKKLYKECLLEYKKEEEIELLEFGRRVARTVKEDIVTRFKVDNQMIKNFSVLEADSIHEHMTKENFRVYGNDELEKCGQHFNKFAQSNGQAQQEDSLIDLSVLTSEWKTLKTDIVTNHFGGDIATLTLLAKDSNTYPALTKLYNFMAAIPITSMECERTFSAMNLVMTPHRNCLLNDTLEDLVLILTYGPELKDFDPLPAIKAWKESAYRRFL
jgi:hypothetical protein